jgi:hypothetical protein
MNFSAGKIGEIEKAGKRTITRAGVRAKAR